MVSQTKLSYMAIGLSSYLEEDSFVILELTMKAAAGRNHMKSSVSSVAVCQWCNIHARWTEKGSNHKVEKLQQKFAVWQ